MYCYHSAVIDADRWRDDAVLLDLDPRLVCTKCGIIGGQVRPNWVIECSGEPDRRALALSGRRGPQAFTQARDL
jgi:hypothetical protein